MQIIAFGLSSPTEQVKTSALAILDSIEENMEEGSELAKLLSQRIDSAEAGDFSTKSFLQIKSYARSL